MRRLLAGLLLLTPAGSGAGQAPPHAKADDTAVVGFTKDGAFFVYRDELELEGPPGPDDAEPRVVCTAAVAVVHDTAADKEVRYLASSEGDDCSGLAGQKELRPTTELRALLQAHPVVELHGPTGPRGTRLVGLHATCAAFSCEKGECQVGFEDAKGCTTEDDPMGQGSIELALRRKDGRTLPLRTADVEMHAMGSTSEALTAYWMPDESQAALVIRRSSGGMRSRRTALWAELARPNAIQVSVLGYSDGKARGVTGATVAEKTAKVIRGLGGFGVSTGKAHDARKETVVYAAKGFEAEAARIAKALPGARVEPLSWKADADIVVACVPSL